MEPAEIFRHNVIKIIEKQKLVQASVAGKIMETPQSFNDYLKGRINWGEKKRKKLASYLNVDYFQLYNQEFSAEATSGIQLGVKCDANHIQTNLPGIIAESGKADIVKRFQNKTLAKAINERLLGLEKIDPAALDKVLAYIEGMISVYQSSFIDRRKSDHPDKIPKGGDRRKAAG